jgi:MYXO-CTERM domain-containing protein
MCDPSADQPRRPGLAGLAALLLQAARRRMRESAENELPRRRPLPPDIAGPTAPPAATNEKTPR